MTGKAAEIYRTAASLIVAKGFNATSMNDIATAVDLTKAGLYHYIRGKQELLFSIMQFAMDMVDSNVLEPASRISDAEERLRFMLVRHAGMTDHVKAITILAEEVAALNELDRELIIARKRRYFDFVRSTLEELKEAGKLRDLDVSVATFNLFAMVLGLARWYRPDEKLSAEAIAEQTTNLLLNGLLKPTP
ncbi:MAG: TetR family transcriptional regulator [Planctomycetales bacterium]|nr:TetR family transcriptional regulator [Planctomycetales bacterium]